MRLCGLFAHLLVGLVGLGRLYRFPLAVQIDEVPSWGGDAA